MWTKRLRTYAHRRSELLVYLEYQAAICVCGRRIYQREGGKHSPPSVPGSNLTLNQINNEVVMWDRIVRRKRDAKLNIESARAKYPLRDPSLTFR